MKPQSLLCPTASSWACSCASWAHQMVTVTSAGAGRCLGLLSTLAQACLHPAPPPGPASDVTRGLMGSLQSGAASGPLTFQSSSFWREMGEVWAQVVLEGVVGAGRACSYTYTPACTSPAIL